MRQDLVSPRDMVDSGLCIGCGACALNDANGPVRLEWDPDGQLKPRGPSEWFGGRGENFSRICPFSPLAPNEDEIAREAFPTASLTDPWIGCFDAAYVGHVAEPGYRERGSSGGMVSWVAAELLKRGMVDGVAHVAACDSHQAENRLFEYRISRTVNEVHEGAKSRYYPIEMSGVLSEMRERPGRYAVVGIPCFIKAARLLCKQDAVMRDRIAFTLGLVCGHMKSRQMVESFAWQMGSSISDVEGIDFRVKNPDRPANWYRAQIMCRDGTSHSQDWWHLVDGDWGSGFFQNGACDFCDDVVAEVADISFGDAWLEPYASDGRGTNVVVVRSPPLHGLIREGMNDGRLSLAAVDAAFVRETQAAAFRQRREGLAYRLSWRHSGVRPRKRVVRSSSSPTLRRKLIYRCRHHISRWSSRYFRMGKWLNRPALFIGWGKAMLYVYQALTYSRGRAGRLADWAEERLSFPRKD